MGPNEREMQRAAAANEAFVVAGALHFMRGVLELSNAGGEGAPPAPIDTGELRGSPRVTVNSPSREQSPKSGPYPLFAVADLNRAVQLGGFGLGDILWASWIARHANIIEGGRRMGSHGRMIGSEQAPDGWVWPGVETQLSRMDRWSYPGPQIAGSPA